MKILGITGGVGSGKSKILYELENSYGAFVLEADKLAHELMEPGQSIYNEIVRHFGREVLSKEAPFRIDRKKLGDIVFNDSEKLLILNGLSHPLVKEHIKSLIEQKKAENKTKLFVIEAALLIQDGYSAVCDEIWYIYVEKEVRIKRLMDSRGYTREKCLAIMNSQESDEYFKKYANFTINNSFDYINSSNQLKTQLNKFL